MDAFPAVVPVRIGKEALQHLRVQIALAREVSVKSAVGETRVGHDLLNRDAIKPKPVEQLSSTQNDSGPGFPAMVRRVGQCFLRSRESDDVETPNPASTGDAVTDTITKRLY